MQPYVLVLAQTSHEGARYVRRAKLPRGRWRVVSKASSIRGVRRAEVHCLPGFHRRPDKHAILSVLRFADIDWRDVEMPPATPPHLQVGPFTVSRDGTISITDAEREQVREGAEAEIIEALDDGTVEVDGVRTTPWAAEAIRNSGAPLSERTLEVAYRYNALRDLEPPFDANAIVVSPEEHARLHAEAAEAPRPKRRRRCADCGELHFKDEPCVRTDGVEEETPDPAKPPVSFDF